MYEELLHVSIVVVVKGKLPSTKRGKIAKSNLINNKGEERRDMIVRHSPRGKEGRDLIDRLLPNERGKDGSDRTPLARVLVHVYALMRPDQG